VAVLVSGSGTNLQALLDDPVVGPQITLVVSSRPGAYALERARTKGVDAIVVDPEEHPDREAHDARLLGELRQRSIEFVLLAGYAERDAIAHGVRISGVTVHIAWDRVDHGPIVVQEPVIVLPDDDEDSLHRRIQEVEHRLYPRAAALLIEGRLKVEGRRVHILEAGS
jgi:phosphoribosylglycinamide formyltransferase 1